MHCALRLGIATVPGRAEQYPGSSPEEIGHACTPGGSVPGRLDVMLNGAPIDFSCPALAPADATAVSLRASLLGDYGPASCLGWDPKRCRCLDHASSTSSPDARASLILSRAFLL